MYSFLNWKLKSHILKSLLSTFSGTNYNNFAVLEWKTLSEVLVNFNVLWDWALNIDPN